jgi:hypothetical protein
MEIWPLRLCLECCKRWLRQLQRDPTGLHAMTDRDIIGGQVGYELAFPNSSEAHDSDDNILMAADIMC